MRLDEIVDQLKQQRSRLDAAIQALEGVGGRGQASRKQTPHYVGGGSTAYLIGDEEALGPTKEGAEVVSVRDATGAVVVSD